MSGKTFLFELRDTARVMQNADYRLMVKELTDKLAAAIDDFANHPTHETLAVVNGLWAKAVRVDYLKPDNAPPPAPLAPALMAAAA